MHPYSTLSDEDLLVSDHPEAFGEFYDRHVRSLLGYFARRTRDAEAAADLTAETFACALVARRRFRPGGPPATAWLFTIASRRLADFHRRGTVERRAQRSLGMERRDVSAEDACTIMLLAEDTASVLLAGLPADQRVAIASRVIDGREYGEVAGELHVSESAVRQRVSRGLQTLRRRLGGQP
jgi:RNA polymerase sigma factor (sigma-70 family)